jgi:hypothetical protein
MWSIKTTKSQVHDLTCTSSCTTTTWTRRTVSPPRRLRKSLKHSLKEVRTLPRAGESWLSDVILLYVCPHDRACQFPHSNSHPLEPWNGQLALISTHNITQCRSVRCSICLLWPVSRTNLSCSTVLSWDIFYKQRSLACNFDVNQTFNFSLRGNTCRRNIMQHMAQG